MQHRARRPPTAFERTRSGTELGVYLWLHDVEAGTEWLLLDPAEASRRPGASAAAVSTDVTLTRAACAVGDELWLVELEGAGPRRVPTSCRVLAPVLDPTGTPVA